jgi:hypothetical protein
MSDRVYDTEDRSPFSAAGKSGMGTLLMCVEWAATPITSIG